MEEIGRTARERVYVVSDIHLELRSDKGAAQLNFDPVPMTDNECKHYLALCGDIGNPFMPNYADFLHRHCQKFDHIFIVSGNHEYYTSNAKQRTIERIDVELHQLAAQFPNVTYLQQSVVLLESGTAFAGCTLWSKVDAWCEQRMNDYNCIYVDSDNTLARSVYSRASQGLFDVPKKKMIKAYRRQLKWMDVLQLHQTHRDWLEQTIKTPPEGTKKLVVLTHHAPSHLMSLPERREGGQDKGYASDCDDLFQPPVVCWLSGHTHESMDIHINGIRSVSNCFGYPSQSAETTGYRPLAIEI